MNGLVWCVGLTTTEADEMAWKTLGDALETAIAMGMESGEMGAATPSQPNTVKKTPRAMKPEASVTGQRQTTTKVVDYANAGEGSRAPSTMDRCMTTARRTTGLPTRSAVVIHTFTVIEGGRRAPVEGGGEPQRPAGRRNSGEGTACEWLKLVHAST